MALSCGHLPRPVGVTPAGDTRTSDAVSRRLAVFVAPKGGREGGRENRVSNSRVAAFGSAEKALSWRPDASFLDTYPNGDATHARYRYERTARNAAGRRRRELPLAFLRSTGDQPRCGWARHGSVPYAFTPVSAHTNTARALFVDGQSCGSKLGDDNSIWRRHCGVLFGDARASGN